MENDGSYHCKQFMMCAIFRRMYLLSCLALVKKGIRHAKPHTAGQLSTQYDGIPPGNIYILLDRRRLCLVTLLYPLLCQFLLAKRELMRKRM